MNEVLQLMKATSIFHSGQIAVQCNDRSWDELLPKSLIECRRLINN